VSEQTALQRRVANLEKMIEVTRTLREAFDLQSLLTEITNSIAELVNCEKSSILLVDPRTHELYFASASGTQFERVKDFVIPPQSIAGTIIRERRPVVVDNAQTDARFFAQVDQATGETTKTLMGVPMEIGGRIIGVLEALNKEHDAQFDDQDVETLLMFAPQAAAAIENTRLLEEQKQRLAESALIQEAVLTLSRFIQKDRLLAQLTDLMENTLEYERFTVWAPRADQDAFGIAAANSAPAPPAPAYNQCPLDDTSTIIGLVATRRQVVNVLDTRETPTGTPVFPDTRSILAVPMLCGENLAGIISIESAQPNAFQEYDERILFQVGLQAAIGLRQAELYEASLRANRLKQEFITTMSHELRTPMTVIISSCEIVAKQTLGSINTSQASMLKIAIDRANLLLRLLNDVLDFSKIAAGDLKLYPTLVDLPHAVQAAITEYQTYLDRKQQKVDVDIPQACRHLCADGKRLRQILGHLIDNAIKFSPEGAKITVRASPYDADYIRVDVIDHGIGIKPQDTELIFEDFRQLDNSFTREYGGAGMGLALSKHLIELQSGIIWVESEFGRGSIFSFILPKSDAGQA